MVQRRNPGTIRESTTEQKMRDQEVLRANRELAAYFRGRRTEREARAALKIVKAFIRDRERRDVKSRAPLPGADAATAPKRIRKGKSASAGGKHHRRPRRKLQDTLTKDVTAPVEPKPESPEE